MGAGRPQQIQQPGAVSVSAAPVSMAAPLVLTGFVSPSEVLPEAMNTTAAGTGAAEPGMDPSDVRHPVPCLPSPSPAGGSPPQAAAYSVAGSWSPIERVRSSLPDVQERASPPDAADQMRGSPGPASGAAAATSRAQLAHSASEVSIELYGSAPSALENGGSGSHDWGGRATEAGGGGSFSAASPGRAAVLAAAITAAVGDDDEDDDLSDDDAAAPLRRGTDGAVEYDQMEGAVSDDSSLVFDHDGHDGRDQSRATRASLLSAQQLGYGQAAAAAHRSAGLYSAAHGLEPQPAAAESSDPHPSPAAPSSRSAERSPASPPAGHAASVSAAQPHAGLLWLPPPIFSSAGESATPGGAAAAASPDKVLLCRFIMPSTPRWWECRSGTYCIVLLWIAFLCIPCMSPRPSGTVAHPNPNPKS